jgi:Rrf2 family protein
VKISLKVDYACRVMAELARLHGTGELAQIGALAKAEAVPPNFLAQILIKLREAGLIVSRRGNQGGYVLARAPEEISLYDIRGGRGRRRHAAQWERRGPQRSPP